MLYFFLIIVNIFFTGCLSSNNSNQKKISLSKEDKHWIEQFFKDFFLESHAIYTVFGTKPLSFKEIIYATEEEWKQNASANIKNLTDKQKELLYKDIKQFCNEYNFHLNWEKWISYIKKYPNSPFLFSIRPTEVKQISLGYILNIQEMVWTLIKHYDVFKKELGYDFDPIKVTMEFTNTDSSFWDKVLSNHLLQGIVHGYGLKNATFFEFYIKESNDNKIPKALFASPSFHPTVHKKPSIKNLPLPRFKSFGLPFNDDPILEMYKCERKKIQKNLNEKNFFEKTLHQITGANF